MSAPRLSALSSQTLSLLLERQRLQTLGKAPPTSQLVNVKRNLELLREGILNMEEGGEGEGLQKAVALRGQWERAVRMLGEDGHGIEECVHFSLIGESCSGTSWKKPSGPDGLFHSGPVCHLQDPYHGMMNQEYH